MKNIKFTKILAFFMAVLMILPLVPTMDLTVFAEGDFTVGPFDYDNGKQVTFDWWDTFDIAADNNGVLDYVNFETVDGDALLVSDVIERIVGGYIDENGNIWYKVSGENLPDGHLLKTKPWVLYANVYDEETGCDPYLCIYGEDEVIQFVTSEQQIITYQRDEFNEIVYDENGNPIILETISLINNYVVSGPSALEGATIQIEAIDSYPISALAYTETIYDTSFSKGYSITITKADGSAWTSADGTVSIRYEVVGQYGGASDGYNAYYGAAFLYENGSVSSYELSDLEYEVSGVVYTTSGAFTLVFEHMPADFEVEGFTGCFKNGQAEVYDNTLSNSPQISTASLFDVLYSFTQITYKEVETQVEKKDEAGNVIIDESGNVVTETVIETVVDCEIPWYWISSSNEYCFVKAEEVDIAIVGSDKELYDQLMATDQLKDYEAIMETVDPAIWESIKNTSYGAEIIEHSYILVYDHYYSVISEAEYMAVKEKYPDAYNYIQADEELKYFNDQILERVKYLDQHPEDRYVQFGDIEYVELPSYTNVAPLVSPTAQAPQARSGIVAPFAYLRSAARAAADDDAANGVLLDKTVTYDETSGTYKVRLEAYTTGATVTTVTEKEMPADIILVLDLSSSMTNGTMDAVGYQQITGATALQGASYAEAENLFVMVGGEYREVSVTGSGSTTTTTAQQYSGDRTINAMRSYLNDGNKLYCYHDGSYREIKITQSGNRYYISCSEEQHANTRYPNSTINNLTLYESIPGVSYEKYTYTYEDENDQTVTITYNANDSIIGGSNPNYYSKVSSGEISYAEALVNAVTNFANQVAQKAKGEDKQLGTDDDVPHSVAIIGFSSDSTDNTGIYIGSTVHNYGTEATGVYGTALQDMSTSTGVSNITASIGALTNRTGTYTHCGTEMAAGILGAQPADRYVKNNETVRSKVVVIFTDGEPRNYNYPVADCYEIKNDHNATVYSVGILDGGDATLPVTTSTSRLNIFMHAMSSNYKNATSSSYADLGTLTNTQYAVDGSNYYLLASNADDLNNIFGSISQSATSGGSITDLSTSTQIRDIISPYFQLPENADVSSIVLKYADYVGEDLWSDDKTLTGATPTISDDRKIIGVTGFDYKENWVGTETSADNSVTYHGKKLIIEFPIVIDPNFLGGTGAVTNGDMSGIYADENASTPIEKFEVPDVDVELKEISTVVQNKYIYYGNTVNLTDILNLYVKRDDLNTDLKVTVDGTNNAYVDLKYTITLNSNTVAVYTIPAGKAWDEGTWEKNQGELLQNYAATGETEFAVECVMTDAGDSSKTSPASGQAYVFVYVPTLTFKDSVQKYKAPLVPASAAVNDFLDSHFVGVTWTLPEYANLPDDEPHTVTGPEPEFTFRYSNVGTAFDNMNMNSVSDVPVSVTVTVHGTEAYGGASTAIEGNSNIIFDHEDCDPACDFNPDTEQFIVHVTGALTTLTIRKAGHNSADPNQTFLFNVVGEDADGNDIDVTVTVHEDGSVTISGLIIGNTYSVTEIVDWSWRYNFKEWSFTDGTTTKTGNTNDASITLGETGNVITFTNERLIDKWLDGDSWLDNLFSLFGSKN